MQHLELNLDTPAANLALDEALLLAAAADAGSAETIRLWESRQVAVVVGRSSRVADEVDLSYCQSAGIPVLRRCSGGAAVVIGPGCLMYSVVLEYARRPWLRQLSNAHCFVLKRLASAVGRFVEGVKQEGVSDLAVGGQKISGNSLRCQRTHFLYHGTLLYDFQLGLLNSCLRMPPRQPEYREGRAHEAFVNNVSLPVERLREALLDCWDASDAATDWPQAVTERLIQERYAADAWNLAR